MSFPFRSILVPVDFDESSKVALDLAKELVAIGDGSLHLLHVVAIVLAPGESASFVVTREEEVRAALEKIAKEQLGGVKHQVHISTGDTARGIVDAARGLHADLIVMPTHGRRGLPRFFLGSVAERVVRDAPCPVLTVRPSAVDGEKQNSVAKIMTTNPPSVSPTDTLVKAHALMQQEDLLVDTGGIKRSADRDHHRPGHPIAYWPTGEHQGPNRDGTRTGFGGAHDADRRSGAPIAQARSGRRAGGRERSASRAAIDQKHNPDFARSFAQGLNQAKGLPDPQVRACLRMDKHRR